MKHLSPTPWRRDAALLCLCTLLFPTIARAVGDEAQSQEERDQKRLADLSLEELMEIRIDEVYTASRFVQKITDAPATVTIVTADDIRRCGYRTLADVFRAIPGTYVTNDRNYSYLGVRGFSLPADYNNRILFLVDGHRVNDAVYDSVLFANEFILDVDTIERIEFIRGPASSLYGSNAYFGVANIMTKKARQVNGVEVAGSAGSLGSYRTRVTAGKAYDSGLEVLFSASYYKSQGNRILYYPEFDDPATNHGYAANADGEYAYNLLGKVTYKEFTFEGAFVYREKTIPTASYATVFGSRDTATWDTIGFLSLTHRHEFEGHLELQTRVQVSRSGYRGDYPYDASGTIPPNIQTFKDSDVGEWWGAEIVASRPFFDGRTKITAGGEYRDYFRLDQKSSDGGVTVQDSKEDSSVLAAFAQVDHKLSDELRLNVGVRYDSYDTVGGSVNPRAGLIYSPAESTHLKALYGRAFRAPSAYELNYATPGVQKPNPDLKPETIDTYELAWEQGLGQNLQLLTRGYYYRCDNLLNLEIDPSDGIKWFRNVDEVTSAGAEVELRARFENGLQGSLSYTYQDTKDSKTHQWLPNSPHHLAKMNLSVPLSFKQTFATVELQYVGERRTLAGPRVDDYLVANLTLSAVNIAEGLDFSASVYNLFNTKYSDPGGIEHQQNQIEQDGLGFRVALTYRF